MPSEIIVRYLMIAEMTFTLYYSLLRRGLFESLGVWGEGKRKRAIIEKRLVRRGLPRRPPRTSRFSIIAIFIG